MSIKSFDDKWINPETGEREGRWVVKGSALAANNKLLDATGEYESDNVEGALAEIGSKIKKVQENLDYINENGTIGGGGGGGGASMPTVELQSEPNYAIATDDTVDIYYFFKSPNLGFGKVYISIDYKTTEDTIPQGRNKITVGPFEKGEHRIDIYVVDIAGMYSNTATVMVTSGALELTSDFSDKEDLDLQNDITINFDIDTISVNPISVELTLDGKTTVVEGYPGTGKNSWHIGNLSTLGVHEATIIAKSGAMVSNMLVFNLVVADGNSLFLSTTFKETQILVGKNLQLDYRNSMAGQRRFTTELFIDGNLVDTVTSYQGYNFWNVGTNLEIGEHRFEAQSFLPNDRSVSSNKLVWNVEVVSTDYIPFKIVEHDLLCNFDANGKQQTSQNKEIWEDESGNNVRCNLHNFNFSTNGWMDNSLKFNGKTYAHIDLRPFELDIPKGLTIDILFKVKNVGDINGKVLWCANPVTPFQGTYINTFTSVMRSANSKMTECQFQDDTWTRMTWVIVRSSTSGGSVMLQYVNAIITNVIYLSDREPFQFGGDIYLGASFNEEEDNLDENGNPIPHYADCAIKTFRVYNTALTSEEVLQNHIADIKDREEQLAKRELNYGESTIPTMVFEGIMDGMSGDVSKFITIDYTDPLDPTKRFRKENCEVQWQGTSSLEYPVKNYTIKLKDGGQDWLYAPKDNWIPESRYTVKANYMDSSQANNVSSARYVNDFFKNYPYPPQLKNPNVRCAIDGFPVKLIINGENMGIYMFNIDRYATRNMGLEGESAAVSYEIGVNSVTGAGAFMDTSWESIRNEFEYRYHYAGDDSVVCETIGSGQNSYTVLRSGFHQDLIDLVNWVANATDEEFLGDLKYHLSLRHTIDYFLIVYLFGLVDRQNCPL